MTAFLNSYTYTSGGLSDRVLNFDGFTVGFFTSQEPGPIYVTAQPSNQNASLFSLHLWPADKHEDHVLGLQPTYAEQASPGMITRIEKPPVKTPGSGDGGDDTKAVWNTWTMVDGNLNVYPPPQNWVAVTYPNGGSGSFNLLAMIRKSSIPHTIFLPRRALPRVISQIGGANTHNIAGWAAIEPFNAQLTYTKVDTTRAQS